jgi:hypothetical protein
MDSEAHLCVEPAVGPQGAAGKDGALAPERGQDIGRIAPDQAGHGHGELPRPRLGDARARNAAPAELFHVLLAEGRLAEHGVERLLCAHPRSRHEQCHREPSRPRVGFARDPSARPGARTTQNGPETQVS